MTFKIINKQKIIYNAVHRDERTEWVRSYSNLHVLNLNKIEHVFFVWSDTSGL